MAVLSIILGYVLGSIPFAYLIARRARNCDIREVGYGNAGTLNVAHEMGWLLGSAVLVGDVGKGALSTWVARRFGLADWMVLLTGLAAMLGHNFPLFLGFRGGKGLATGLGVLLTLMPGEMFVALLVLALFYLVISRNIAFSAIVSMVFLSWLAAWRELVAPLVIAPWAVLVTMGTRALPQAWRTWVSSTDKRDLILHEFLFPHRGREPRNDANEEV